MSVNSIWRLLKTVIHSNFLTNNDNNYHKIEGFIIEISYFLLVLNLYFAFYKYVKKLLDLVIFLCFKNMDKILIYTRYIDNIFFIFKCLKRVLISTFDKIELKPSH